VYGNIIFIGNECVDDGQLVRVKVEVGDLDCSTGPLGEFEGLQ
jgi:hypothetical protein